MSPIEQNLKTARIIHAAFLTTVPAYAAIGEVVAPGRTAGEEFGLIRLMFLVVSVSTVAVGFSFRKGLLRAAGEALRARPEDAAAAGRWFTVCVGSLAIAEAVAVFGLVLRFLGGTLVEGLPFYGAGFVLLLAWKPRRPA